MDIRKDLESLCDIISEKLVEKTRKVRNGGMSDGDLETLDKLTHTMKSIKGVMTMMDDESGYSGRYAYRDGGSYRGGQRRDSMGRYSGERGYSRNAFADELRELMEQAPDERTRQKIQRMAEEIENA